MIVLHRRLSKKCIAKACVVFVVGLALYVVFVAHTILGSLPHRCTHQQSRDTLRKLCELYQNQIINGSLCNDLCNGNVQYLNCLHDTKGKIVMLAQWRNDNIILKSKHASLEDYTPVYSVIENLEGVAEKLYPEDVILRVMLKSQAQVYLGSVLKEEDDILNRFWFGDWSMGQRLFHASVNSLWTLMQQGEYVFLKYYNNHPNLPRVLGLCGHFYAVEFYPPGTVLEPEFLNLGQQLQSAPWQGRANVALGFLNLIKALDSSFPEKLHHCDVKEGNFGLKVNTEWSKEVLIKAIDVDMLFFNNKIGELMGQGDCVKNSDCDFFHCRGQCNEKTGICAPKIINSNLQVFCSNIFLPKNGRPGLLRYPPASIAKELSVVLGECTKQLHSTNQGEIIQTITKLLESSIH